MDAARALDELMDLSSQIAAAVVLGEDGSVVAATDRDEAAAGALARSALELVGAAAELGGEVKEVTRVEVELEEGALFVLREGGRAIAATTGPEPTSGLVVYDLRTCLQAIEDARPKRKRAARKTKDETA